MDVRAADINNTRFMHGLYVQYGCGFMGEKKVIEVALSVQLLLAFLVFQSKTIEVDK